MVASDERSKSVDYRSRERAVLSVADFTREDGISFFEFAAVSGIRIVTGTFPLMEANEALSRLRKGYLVGAAVLMLKEYD